VSRRHPHSTKAKDFHQRRSADGEVSGSVKVTSEGHSEKVDGSEVKLESECFFNQTAKKFMPKLPRTKEKTFLDLRLSFRIFYFGMD
jgi:hypothetical protein